MIYFLIVWLLCGMWRVYKFLSFDIRDEGHVSWGHITFSLLLIIGGVISILDNLIHLEVLYGYQIVDSADEWYNKYTGHVVREVEGRWLDFGCIRVFNKSKRDDLMDKYIPVEIIEWGTINKIFHIYPDINREEPIICRYMTDDEHLTWVHSTPVELIDVANLKKDFAVDKI